jgi:hypothetical protein
MLTQGLPEPEMLIDRPARESGREIYVLFQIHTFRHEDDPAGPFADIGLVFVEVRDTHELESDDQLAQFDGRGLRLLCGHPLGSCLSVQDSIAGAGSEMFDLVGLLGTALVARTLGCHRRTRSSPSLPKL